MRRALRRRRGFTLIEVMVAVSVMTVGALGLMALQQAATRGNSEARQMTLATQLTRTWIERLRRDATLWTAPGQPILTNFLVQAPAVGTPLGPWDTPPPRVRTDGTVESPLFDHFGADHDPGAADPPTYFTNVQYAWLDAGDTLRVNVRTVWHRSRPTQRINFAPGSEAAVTAALIAGVDLHGVFASAVIRRGGR
jgi:prepilin-type N-terminal cleavage/methylation domain-containing protein